MDVDPQALATIWAIRAPGLLRIWGFRSIPKEPLYHLTCQLYRLTCPEARLPALEK